ncbi:Receptor-like serine/threonine-protein kinase SD1-8 [Forsythia ovata]|uniref:Receptor-like serine/threonine-protein kinase SD1-8 n=1 Tax=Forsythia ovata TaxID=205694 RepID=A0ABD1S6R2_9LAMI
MAHPFSLESKKTSSKIQICLPNGLKEVLPIQYGEGFPWLEMSYHIRSYLTKMFPFFRRFKDTLDKNYCNAFGVICLSGEFDSGWKKKIQNLGYNSLFVQNAHMFLRGQIFELGFFSPGRSKDRFLGIWYKATPEIVVWVANRNQPITDSQGILTISRNGTLVLSRGERIIWSSNLSSVASSPVMQLLQTGNLVLVDKTNGTFDKYIWQSFDYPCDTRLPGMQIVYNLGDGQDKYLQSWRSSDDPSLGDFTNRIEYRGGLVEMVVYNASIKRSRSGPWTGHYFSNLPFTPTIPFKPNLVINKDMISVSDAFNSSLITRLTLDKSGSLHRYTMDESKNRWNLVHSIPRDSCDNYAQCGPNGICRISKVPICECLKGFAPRSQQDWDLQDWAGGCIRTRPLNCQNGDGFEKVGANFPDTVAVSIEY